MTKGPETGRRHPPVRVLAMEDDPLLQGLLKRFISGGRYRLDIVEDGKKGLKKLASHDYDLVLVDLIMPIVSGFQDLEVLDERIPPLPTIITSGTVHPDVHVYLKTHPWVEIVSKPYTRESLLVTVEALLSRPRPSALAP